MLMRVSKEHGQEPGDRVAESRRSALIGLIIVLVLLGGGLWLIHVLRAASQLQDCVMSGRSNCAPIDSTPSSH
jgi:hypothetical protein